MNHHLPGVFGTLAPYLHDYGYFAVIFFVGLENIVPFFPGEAAIITAAVFARAGDLSLGLVFLLAFLAAFVGNNVSYALGRYGGRPLVLKLRVKPEHLDRVEAFYERFGPRVVIVARFLPVIRHVSGITAGVSKMGLRAWLVNNAIGAALWAGAWTGVGYLAGGHLKGVDRFLTRGLPVLGLLLIVAVVLVLVRRRRKAAVT